ncbi:MAG: right-handed parallel beta-helix repeat-containing protein [Syntrophales bacterium]|nr:right-handed parallel beta-helix repeat-containing protein [Syntrophales bacterium]
MKKTMGAVAFQVFLAIMLVSVCSARDWYVRPAGSGYGSGDGTSYANAWSGFSRIVWGANGVTAGDVLYVCGTHGEKLTVGASGASGAKIAIRGNYSGDPGVINPNYGANHCIDISNRRYVAVEGLILRRSSASGINAQNSYKADIRNCQFRSISSGGTSFGIDGRYASAMFIYGNSMNSSEGSFNASGIVVNLGTASSETSVVERNTIIGIQVDGIVTGNNVVVTGNTVGELLNTSSHSDGIVVQGSNVVVRQNTVYDCTQCIYVDSFDYGSGAQTPCNNVSIWGNLVYGTSRGHSVGINGISIHIETQGAAVIDNLKIYNNTVADCNYNGITFGGASGGNFGSVTVVNNIVVNSGGNNMCVNFNSQPPRSVTMDYNLVYSNYDSSGRAWRWYGSSKTLAEMRALGHEAHGKSQAPAFTKYTQNADGNVFTLTSGSQAIDSGTGLASEYARDRNNYSRPQGSAWDMGCYEYGSSGGNVSPPRNLRIRFR